MKKILTMNRLPSSPRVQLPNMFCDYESGLRESGYNLKLAPHLLVQLLQIQAKYNIEQS